MPLVDLPLGSSLVALRFALVFSAQQADSDTVDTFQLELTRSDRTPSDTSAAKFATVDTITQNRVLTDRNRFYRKFSVLESNTMSPGADDRPSR